VSSRQVHLGAGTAGRDVSERRTVAPRRQRIGGLVRQRDLVHVERHRDERVVADHTWYEITGTYTDLQTTDPINNGVIPYLNVIQAKPDPAPDDEYESQY
jgi:hypothetical protein